MFYETFWCCSCAQKIVTQLETVPDVKTSGVKNYFQRSGYEKLPTSDPLEAEPIRSRRWDKSPDKDRQWTSRIRDKDRHKSEELVDNKKNELVEKKLVETEKQMKAREKEVEKQLKKELKEEKKKAKKEAKADKKS